MTSRRGLGVGAVHKKHNIQAKFQAKGDQLASDQLQQFSQQFDVFVQKLEEFASKHREEIRKNSQFRRHFQEMCITVGVDPLASGKGFWAEKLGVGDFYYELAVKIIEACLSTNNFNGGLITVDDLRNRLLCARSKARKEPISYDDIIRAVKKLKALGQGFELITLGGGRFLVQSIPGELSMDDARILQLAEESGGYVSSELIADHLQWDAARIERVLNRIVSEGIVWIESVDESVQYWYPSLFFEQYSFLSGSGTKSNSSANYNY